MVEKTHSFVHPKFCISKTILGIRNLILERLYIENKWSLSPQCLQFRYRDRKKKKANKVILNQAENNEEKELLLRVIGPGLRGSLARGLFLSWREEVHEVISPRPHLNVGGGEVLPARAQSLAAVPSGKGAINRSSGTLRPSNVSGISWMPC